MSTWAPVDESRIDYLQLLSSPVSTPDSRKRERDRVKNDLSEPALPVAHPGGTTRFKYNHDHGQWLAEVT